MMVTLLLLMAMNTTIMIIMPIALPGYYANLADQGAPHAGDGAGSCACNSPRLERRGVHRFGHPEGGLDVSAVGQHVPGVDAVKQAESQHLSPQAKGKTTARQPSLATH
eukprot:scaffold17662_cov19-Prasinocladus_malaysianus.AAC.1